MRLKFAIILALALSGGPAIRADLATITVDLAKKTVSPENPTINIAANDAVLLRIVVDGKNLPSEAEAEYATYLTGPTPLEEISERKYNYAPEDLSAIGASPLLLFRQCNSGIQYEYEIALPMAVPIVPRCPIYTRDGTKRAWTIVIDEGILLVRATAKWNDKGIAKQDEYAFALQVVDRKYALGWSAGFAFLNIRDEQYRLEPINGDDQNMTLARAVDGQIPYQLSAFAHYTRLARRTRSTSISFGLASKVPVNELTAMLGMTVSLRTLPLVNAGHLTIGLAYAPRKELIADYRGRPTVPAGVSVASLTSSRYALGAFVGVTFSFFGGEEQFKGVYSGPSTSEAKP